jgi:Domain of unknown function (DUF4345)
MAILVGPPNQWAGRLRFRSMKRALQITVALLSLLPLTFGVLGLTVGVGRFLPGAVVPPDLDSQFRFMSAWYLGLAFMAWWIIPAIERHTTLFRIICMAVFLGGLGRLTAWYFSGAPTTRFMVVMGAELMFPLLIIWQARVAKQYSR